jgi:hypothetical protein
MTVKLILFSILFFFCFSITQATVIKGVVKDSAGGVLDNVTIYIKDNTGYTLSYTRSNFHGKFEFNIMPKYDDSIWICASIIGYSQVCKKINTKLDTLIVIRLLKKTFTLNEVIVKKTIFPLTTSGDTTKYNIAKLTDGTEYKLEDILKKLPGIRVDENGSIAFKGKKINKILLEGEDFFSKDYKILTKNLSASLIEKVDAIENYNEEDLLKDIQNGNETILNIGVKKSKKLKVFGDLSVGLGNDNNKLISSNILSLISRYKFGLINNYNTIGQDVKPDIQEQVLIKDILNRGMFNATGRIFPINNLSELNTNSTSTRYIDSKPGISALQINTKFSPTVLFKSYTNFKTNQLIKYKNVQTLYTDGANSFATQDSGKNTANPTCFYTENSIDIKIDSLSKIKLLYSYGNNKIEMYSNSLITVFAQKILAPYENNNKDEFSTKRITYIKKINASAAIQFEFLVLKNNNGQNLLSYTDRYNTFLNISNSNIASTQSVNFMGTDNVLQMQYFKKIKKNSFTASAAYYHSSQYLSSNISYRDNVTNSQTKIDSLLFNNSLNSNSNSSSIEIRDEIKLNNFFADASLMLQNSDIIIQNELNKKNEQFSNHNFTPFILVGYKINSKSKLALAFTKYNEFNSILNNYISYIQVDPNTFASFKTFNYTNRKTDFIIKYQYNNFFENGLMYSTTLIFSKQSNPSISSLQFYGTTNLLSKYISDASCGSTLFNFQLDKFIKPLKSTIKINNNLTQGINFDNNNVVNFNKNKLLSTTFDFAIQTGFKGHINFRTTYSSNYTSVSILLNDNSIFKQISNSNFKIKESLVFNVGSTFFGVFSAERFAWVGNNKNNVAYFGDINFTYKPKNEKWYFDLNLRNIFNNEKLYFTQVSSQISTSETTTLLKRMLFLSVNFKF